MARLKPRDVLGRLLDAIRMGGMSPLLIEARNPYLIRLVGSGPVGFDVRVYIWNCRPGGNTRAPDEWRVQGTPPPKRDAHQTFILGWHEDKEVFAAWDIERHDENEGKSSSMQIKEPYLEAARTSVFAIYEKDGGEIVVAFRPEHLLDYFLASASLHGPDSARRDIELVEQGDALPESAVDAIGDAGRKEVVRIIRAKQRAYDFAKRVLAAYGHECAFCGVQLGLLDAAHILPVSILGSTDKTSNGVALCKLHHYAYDSNLVSFNPAFGIEISNAAVADFKTRNLHGGLSKFRAGLRRSILPPTSPSDRPPRNLVIASRKARGWRA